MLQLRLRIWDHRLALCGAATIAFALTGASTAFTIVDAVILNLKVKTWGVISTTAAITGCFALVNIIVLAICRLGCSGAWLHRWLLPWSGALVAVVAAVFSVNAIVLKAINSSEVKLEQHGQANTTGQFALWSAAQVTQCIFYAFVVLRRLPKDSTLASSLRKETRSAPGRPRTPPTPPRIVVPPYALTQSSTALSPSTTADVESKTSSWRDSLVSLHPNNPRIKLLGSRKNLSRQASVQSAESKHSDAFDLWDTSNVDLSIREALTPVVSSRGTALETIPGSRPASPARALDGPFLDLEEGIVAFLPLVERPPTAQSQNSFSQQRIKRTFIPASRPMSPSESSSDESHIHPLFRTDSPTPPPAISRDTIVVASPIGGHMIPALVIPRPASRMRSASQLSSQATSHTGSRAPSCASSMGELPSAARQAQSTNELRPLNSAYNSSSPYLPSTMGTGSPLPSRAGFSDRSRSSSPISRGLTPPIPEFILSAKKEGRGARVVERR
jgi:hypothetical protein